MIIELLIGLNVFMLAFGLWQAIFSDKEDRDLISLD